MANTEIQLFTASHIPLIVQSFQDYNPKPTALFEKYLQDQRNNERLVWVAIVAEKIVGYVTLQWHSKYLPFKEQNIPEIVDLNVITPFQGQGIGAQLLATAEKAALKKSTTVGIGVGLYKDYGRAQQLYVKRGYIPNGEGITYNYQPVAPGAKVILDDDLILWFTKTT